jgi:hypothetical protein
MRIATRSMIVIPLLILSSPFQDMALSQEFSRVTIDPLIVESSRDIVRDAGIGTDIDSFTNYLNRYLSTSERLQAISKLIPRLAAPTFSTRDEAFQKLREQGNAARPILEASSESEDPEIRWRVTRLLENLDSDDELKRQLSITIAILQLLKAEHDSGLVPLLLKILPSLPSDSRDIAFETIWARVSPEHVAQLRDLISNGTIEQQAVALVAIELVSKEESSSLVAPYLQSPYATIRLSAARALLDRQPDQSIATLIPLTGYEDSAIALQADALLRQKTHPTLESIDTVFSNSYWKAWLEKLPDSPNAWPRLGNQRLDLFPGRLRRAEHFHHTVAPIREVYNWFTYAADNQGKASVKDGILHLQGDQAEGDQRLMTTSQKLMGRPTWPDKLEVIVRLAGANGNNFGWHPGVSVGNIKVLFHPGVEGGAFRAETVEDHDYLFNNTDMGFEIQTDTMYDMSIHVTRRLGGADFKVTVREPKTGNQFEKSFEVTDNQLGRYDRIGLERSGRTGGDALFDSLTVQLGR